MSTTDAPSLPAKEPASEEEPSPCRVGDKLRDNDPRMFNRNRVLRVVAVGEHSVSASDVRGFTFKILKRRIYADGRLRKSGFSLLRNEAHQLPQADRRAA